MAILNFVSIVFVCSQSSHSNCLSFRIADSVSIVSRATERGAGGNFPQGHRVYGASFIEDFDILTVKNALQYILSQFKVGDRRNFLLASLTKGSFPSFVPVPQEPLGGLRSHFVCLLFFMAFG